MAPSLSLLALGLSLEGIFEESLSGLERRRMALAAGKEVYGSGPYILEDVKFVKGCFLPKGDSRVVQTVFNPQDSTFQVHSQTLEAAQSWVFHAGGIVRITGGIVNAKGGTTSSPQDIGAGGGGSASARRSGSAGN